MSLFSSTLYHLVDKCNAAPEFVSENDVSLMLFNGIPAISSLIFPLLESVLHLHGPLEPTSDAERYGDEAYDSNDDSDSDMVTPQWAFNRDGFRCVIMGLPLKYPQRLHSQYSTLSSIYKMSKTYRVFLGAPSFSDIQRDPRSYSWSTFSSSSSSTRLTVHGDQTRTSLTEVSFPSKDSSVEGVAASAPQVQFTESASMVLPADLLEAVSERISVIYKDAIFGEEDEDEELANAISGQFISDEGEEKEVEMSIFHGIDQSSVFTWPSTSKDQTDDSASRILQLNPGDPSLVAYTQSPSSKRSESPSRSQQQEFSTATPPESQSFGVHSWTSSVSRFPSFHFSLHSLSSLSSLSAQASEIKGKYTRKVNLVLAVLEVEGPDTVRIKKGIDAGKEVAILKMILGDETNEVCKITAWREIAEEWGGCTKAEGAKRGDVVYLQNVTASCEPATSITLSASTYHKSTLTICFRTMPSTVEDGKLRPDLRLAISEPCVRRVADIVRWFEQTAGLV